VMGKLFFLFFCALSLAATDSQIARADSVTTNAFAEVFDDPGSASSPNPDNVTCPPNLNTCSSRAAVSGANTFAETTASGTLTPHFITFFIPNVIQPGITLGGLADVNASQKGFTTAADLSGTATWSDSGAIGQATGTHFNSFNISNGQLIWTADFNLNLLGGSAAIQFNFNVTGQNAQNSPISATSSLSLTCTSASCSSNTSPTARLVSFDPLSGTGQIVAILNLTGFNSNWTVGESAMFQVGATKNQSINFSFQDPDSLTYLDANGNIVPDLVLYDPTLNGVIGLSGQDFLAAETPIPAALPLYASGLGVIGLLGRRRKRRAQAVA
jgi:hypothetical protein